jgi:hypothetical protein
MNRMKSLGTLNIDNERAWNFSLTAIMPLLYLSTVSSLLSDFWCNSNYNPCPVGPAISKTHRYSCHSMRLKRCSQDTFACTRQSYSLPDRLCRWILRCRWSRSCIVGRSVGSSQQYWHMCHWRLDTRLGRHQALSTIPWYQSWRRELGQPRRWGWWQ